MTQTDWTFESTEESLKAFSADVIDLLLRIRRESAAGLFPLAASVESAFRELVSAAPEEGLPQETVLDEFGKNIVPSLFNSLQPRILQLMAAPIPQLAIVDLIVAFLNLQPYPVINLRVERLVVQWLIGMTAYRSDGFGLMTGGGSFSNLYALAAARVSRAGYELRKEGGRSSALVLYTSEECHSSIYKAVELLGIGRDQLRIVTADACFRIRLDLLEQAIRQDLASGLQPFCLVAHLGSVRVGSVDPIGAMAGLAKKYGLWLHIDGAYGAFGALCPDRQELFRDVNLADSMTVDPHKWLNIPFESSCLLIKDKRYLSDTFDHVSDYVGGSPFDADNGMRYGFELTKSDRALKIWFALKLFGVNAYREMISQHIKWVSEFAASIALLEEFELACPPELSICCFRYVPVVAEGARPPSDFYLNNLNSAIELTLKMEEHFLVTSVRIGKKLYLRICLISHRLTACILPQLITAIQTQGRRLDAKMKSI